MQDNESVERLLLGVVESPSVSVQKRLPEIALLRPALGLELYEIDESPIETSVLKVNDAQASTARR